MFFKNILIVDRMYRMRRNQWQALTAHQSKKDEDGYEFQDYVFTIAPDENCKIFGGGMIKDRVANLNMTVYARTVSGKTTSVKCVFKQNANKNNGNSCKKDIDPKGPTVPREPRESVERQENNRRKQY